MSGGHGGTGPTASTSPGASPVHRLPPEVKIAATLAFVFAVVATPREAFWAFGVRRRWSLAGVVAAGRAAARAASPGGC